MILLRTTELPTNQTPDELLSRLAWKTHPVKNVIFLQLSIFEVDSNKPLIGKIDKVNHSFVLAPLHPYPLQLFVPQIVTYGQVMSHSNQVKIKLRYRLGFFTFAYLLFLLYAIGKSIWDIGHRFNEGEFVWDEMTLLIILLSGIVLITLYAVNKQADNLSRVLEINQ